MMLFFCLSKNINADCSPALDRLTAYLTIGAYGNRGFGSGLVIAAGFSSTFV